MGFNSGFKGLNRQVTIRRCHSAVHYEDLETTVRKQLRMLEPNLYRDEIFNFYDLENVAFLSTVPPILFVSKLVYLNKIKNDISYDVICSLLQTLHLLRYIDRAICGLLL